MLTVYMWGMLENILGLLSSAFLFKQKIVNVSFIIYLKLLLTRY